ncbi:CynX/NimT family MFS transporter [Niallia sp. Krafla_26]|uniref:CynX/NimT family MFS transporter n=1 Tax=Niallia sp. Krafla_26 TaxID=3064703 RepID=UPI003D17E96E
MNVPNHLDSFQKTDPHSKGRHQSSSIFLLIGIISIAINLRAPLTSVGPLIDVIRDHLHLSNTLAGMITTLPLLSFGIFSLFVPKLSQRFGMEQILFYAIILLTIGVILRSTSGISSLYIGTTILGLAIAVCNVLLPSMIKGEYPQQIGLMTGIYSVTMNLMGAIASGVSIPIAMGLGLGWQGALGIWAILSFVAILVWLPQFKKSSTKTLRLHQKPAGRRMKLWRSSLAWQVTFFMGLQSMIFYVLIAWLPEILKQQGMGSDQAGWYLSIMQLAVLPVTFIAPILAGRMSDQRLLVTLMSGSLLIGLLGLLLGSLNFIVLWVVLLGIGSGLSFSLAMTFFSLRTENASQAAELSGMAQSVGYFLAAVGPTLFGFLYDLTGRSIPLLLLLGVTIVLFIVGFGAGRNQVISSSKK